MSKDLISTNIAGYSVLSEPEAREQLELFRKLISEVSREEREGDVTESKDFRRVLFHDRRCRCWLVEHRGKKYLFKLDKRDRHRVDYLLQSFFLGSNAMRLMRTLHRAFRAGFDGAAKIYLVADKRFWAAFYIHFSFRNMWKGMICRRHPKIFTKNTERKLRELLKHCTSSAARTETRIAGTLS